MRLYYSILIYDFFILLKVLCALVYGEAGCPPPENIVPCKCYDSALTHLDCSSLHDTGELREVFKNSEGYTYKQVHILHSTFQNLPHDIFKYAVVKELYLQNSTLDVLFDSPPEELKLLEKLHLEEATIKEGLSWELLQPLTQLKFLNIYFNSIKTIDSEFSTYVSRRLEQITFYATETRKIKPGILSEFTNLKKIAFDACKLTQLTRDMFPRPSSIRGMYFNENRIISIPEDLFIDMPNLQTIGMTNNLISMLPEAAFGGNMAGITYVWFDGNPLNCDCRMEWITRNKPSDLRGVCKSPGGLYGKELKDLSPSDFNC